MTIKHIANQQSTISNQQSFLSGQSLAIAILLWNDPAFEYYESILEPTGYQMRKARPQKSVAKETVVVKLYPNPARDYFTLIYKVPETNKGYPVILITDITGRVIHRIDAQSYSGDVLVDATNFVSGVYSVSLITADNRQSMQRLVIVR